MATILATAVDIQAFVSTDIYRYDVDNRPLLNLMNNDIAMNTELIATTAEVVQARTGLLQTYASLDARLDDLELAAGYPQKQIAFNEFLARAAAWQARYASGSIFPITEVVKISDIWSTSPSLLTPIDGNNGNPGFGQLLLRDTNVSEGTLRVQLANGLEPRLTTGTGLYDFKTYRPIPFNINGMMIQLFNEAGGAASTGNTNEIVWNLPAAPVASGRLDFLWIEVWFKNISRTAQSFYPYGAVGSFAAPLTDADHPELRGNVGFYGGNNGDYFQVQHRLRVTSGVTPDTNPFGMSDQTVVLAQGANSSVPGSPTARNIFVSGTKSKGDPGVWIAGNGDSTAKSELGTIDGYVYAIPVGFVFRRNTAQWTSSSNQNGSRTSGGTGTWATGDSARPDGYYHDKIEKEDIVLLAPSCLTDRGNLRRILYESFDRLLRGQLKTKHGYLDYSQSYIEDTVATTNEPVGGSQLVAASAISAAAEAKTYQFIEADGSTKTLPDDFRRLFGPQTETQPVGFTIDVAGAAGTPANFASYGTNIITLKAIGQSAGVGQATAVISEAPVLWWSGSKKPVVIVGSWSGLGTGTISATVNTGDSNYSGSGIIVGLSKIALIGTTGIIKANVSTVGQTYITPAAATHNAKALTMLGADTLLGPSGIAIDATYMYVADRIGQKVYKVNRSTLAVVNTFGVYKTVGSDNAHLYDPSAIAVDGSGNVYVADTTNHRVVKLTSALAYSSQFGVTATAGAGATKLNYPLGVTVDGSGNVYISDSSNYRVVKLDNTLTYVSQFGVTGTALPDNTHCVFPKHNFFGDDSNLYVADQSRIMVINPSTMAAISFLEHGYQIPASHAVSPSVISPYGSLNAIREDSTGNKYVLHSSGTVNLPGPHVGYILTKYDSNWVYQGRYGARWDTAGLWGGTNAGTTDGLIFPFDACLDEGNDAIHIFETNEPSDSTTGVLQNRIISLKMSDLSLRQVRTSNATLTAGAYTPYGPFIGNRVNSTFAFNPTYVGLNYPELRFKSVEFDSANHYCYIAYGGYVSANGIQNAWQRVEKWSAAGTDPDTWSTTATWGSLNISYFGGVGYRYVAWLGTPNDSVNPLSISPYGCGLSMSKDGSAVFIADNHSIIKLSSSGSGLTYAGRFGFAGQAGNDAGHLNFADFGGGTYPYSNYWGCVQAFVASEADATGRLYVSDTNNQRMVILRNSFNTSGSPGAYVASYTGSRFQYINVMNGASYALTSGAAKLWCKALAGSDLGIYELNIAGSNRDAPVYVDGNATAFATIYVPMSLSALPNTISGFNFFGITKLSGLLYWTDFNTDQLVSVQTPDYRFIGECGTPGVSGKDLATWAHPAGIAADASNVYLCDFGNARILVSDPHVAFIEPGIGRVEFLTPPEVGSKYFCYEKFTTMQEIYQRGRPSITATISNPADRYPRLTGRSVLVPPEMMLITTLGRGTAEQLADPAVVSYANCIQRLPIPPGLSDEKGARPTDFSLTVGSPARPFFFTPLISSSSGNHGGYPQEGASAWQKDTILSFLDVTLATAGLRGGYQAIGYIPGPPGFLTPYSATGPKLTGPSCSSTPTYRYVASPFLVAVEGEVLLAIRVMAFAGGSTDNELGISPVEIVGLYRPVGHPMLPNNGEADTNVTIV